MNLTFPPKVIKASAGSGKTFQLSSRFLALVIAGEQPERILATTFTKKAAGEIRERVLMRLSAAAKSKESAADLGKEIGLNLSQPQALDALTRTVRSQHRLNICTLDSFFFQIAIGFGYELGLVPGWGVSDPELDRQVITDAVRELCRDSDQMIQLIRLLNRGALKRSVQSQIEAQVKEHSSLARWTDSGAWAWLKEKPEGAFPKEALLRLQYFPVPKDKKTGEELSSWRKALTTAIENFQGKEWDEFLKAGFAKSILSKQLTYYKRALDPEQIAIFQPLIDYAGVALVNRIAAQNIATRKLLDKYLQIYNETRAKSRTLSFDDVKFKLIEATAFQDLEALYYRLDSRLSHLLLDEFQDTSALEWKVIEPVAAEILSKLSAENSFFCVGDVKQAIYGWRGGEAGIFDSLEQLFPQLAEMDAVQGLEQSYRSAQPIVDTVNRVFSNISESTTLSEHRGAAQSWGERFNAHSTNRTELLGYVSLEEVEGEDEDKGAVERAIIERVIARIQHAQEQYPEGTIGILVRRNEMVARYRYEFSKLGVGIAASEEGGNPLTDSPAVSLLLSLLTIAEHPGDSIAAFHIAESPLALNIGISHGADLLTVEQIGIRTRVQIGSIGLGATINGWVKLLSPSVSERDNRRLSQLVECGYIFDQKSPDRLDTFVQYVREHRVEDPSSAKVRIMTIHKSKGLEFDTVILPELDYSMLGRSSSSMLTKAESSLSAPVRVSRALPKDLLPLCAPLEEMYQASQCERIEESLSVLYVALTRARHALHMFIKAPKKKSTSNDKRPSSATFARLLQEKLSGGSSDDAFIYECGDRDWARNLSAKAVEQTQAVQDFPLQFATAVKPRMRWLPKSSPTNKSNDSDLSTVFQSTTRFSRGLALHKLFEQIGWLEDGILSDQELAQALRSAHCLESEIAGHISQFRSLLENESIAKYLRRSSYQFGTEPPALYRESSCTFVENSHLSLGRFDRVVRYKDAKGAELAQILDYKTDDISGMTEAEFAARSELYVVQMRGYREALSRLFLVDPPKISLVVLFVMAGRAVLID